MILESFPKERLVPKGASIHPSSADFNIRIDLQSFVLDDKTVETAFCLDGARLPTDTRAWAYRGFAFPRNPADGYIDGSIYIRNVHNPADVTMIRFGERRGNSISAEFSIRVDFEFERTGFQDIGIQIRVPLQICDT